MHKQTVSNWVARVVDVDKIARGMTRNIVVINATIHLAVISAMKMLS
jgi:hypothetical protein